MACDHKKALDLAATGSWEEAHALVQAYNDPMSCLIHGYLHRVEGDLGNARYWYARAGEQAPNNTLEEELDRLGALIEAD